MKWASSSIIVFLVLWYRYLWTVLVLPILGIPSRKIGFGHGHFCKWKFQILLTKFPPFTPPQSTQVARKKYRKCCRKYSHGRGRGFHSSNEGAPGHHEQSNNLGKPARTGQWSDEIAEKLETGEALNGHPVLAGEYSFLIWLIGTRAYYKVGNLLSVNDERSVYPERLRSDFFSFNYFTILIKAIDGKIWVEVCFMRSRARYFSNVNSKVNNSGFLRAYDVFKQKYINAGINKRRKKKGKWNS